MGTDAQSAWMQSQEDGALTADTQISGLLQKGAIGSKGVLLKNEGTKILTLNKSNVWAYCRVNQHGSLNVVVPRLRIIGIQHRLGDVRDIFLVSRSLTFFDACSGRLDIL